MNTQHHSAETGTPEPFMVIAVISSNNGKEVKKRARAVGSSWNISAQLFKTH